MSPAREYKQLAKDMFQLASEEQSAQLRAQWEILGTTYLEISKQSPESDDLEGIFDSIHGEILNPD